MRSCPAICSNIYMYVCMYVCMYKGVPCDLVQPFRRMFAAMEEVHEHVMHLESQPETHVCIYVCIYTYMTCAALKEPAWDVCICIHIHAYIRM